MNEDRPPCRRCGKIPDRPVTIYKPDGSGALWPSAAQCRERCAGPAPPRPPTPPRPAVVTAYKPGRCAECTRHIVPDGKITHLGDGRFIHYEGAPAEHRRV
jgi:hypothetical protein